MKGQSAFETSLRFPDDVGGAAADGDVEVTEWGGELTTGGGEAAAAGDCFCFAGGSRRISFFARPGGKGPFGTPVS